MALLKTWEDCELEAHFIQIKIMLKVALTAQSDHVRVAAREAMCLFAERW